VVQHSAALTMSHKRPFTGLLIIIVTILGGLVAATSGSSLFQSQIQAPHCYEYARSKALPDLDSLEFSGVTIATNRFRGHVCQFTDTRTGNPVSLAFDEADIPYGQDTLQVACMVAPFLCVGAVGSALWSLLAARAGAG
jgi:hypothetical protein